MIGWKKFLLVLAVGIFVGSMAGFAIANEQGMDSYGSEDAALSADPERSVGQPDVGEIREPMETGAVPDRSGSSSDLNCCTDSGDPTFRLGGP